MSQEQIFPQAERYRQNWPLRVVIVLLLSLTHYELKDYPLEGLLWALIVIAFAEYETINLLTERNFYPANQFVDRWFPDRCSIANKAGYTVVHIVSLAMVLLVLLWLF